VAEENMSALIKLHF